jgi:hypothetical protein
MRLLGRAVLLRKLVFKRAREQNEKSENGGGVMNSQLGDGVTIVLQSLLVLFAVLSLLFTACSLSLIGSLLDWKSGVVLALVGIILGALCIFLFIRNRRSKRSEDEE